MRALYLALDSRRRSTCERGLIAINAGLAIGFAVVLYRNLAQPGAVVASDFTVFWSGWTLILHGHASGLYDAAAQRATQELLMHGMHFEGGLMAFLNPPHAALASAPFGWLADRVGGQRAFIVWTSANLILLCLVVRSVLDEWGADTRRHTLLLTSAILGFYPVFAALKNGQASILLALAVIGVYRAAKADRPWAGGAWLTVLTIKPQLVPIVVIYLAAGRRWRLLGCASAITMFAVAITALVLGPAIWIDYLRQVPHLEHFWGSGTPDYMLNVRGALTRLFGLDAGAWVEAVSYAVWLASMAVVAALLYQRRLHEADDPRPAYALVIAAALLTNPHLFVHDAFMWTVPLVLYAASLRDAGADWQRFVQFALLWPAIFAVAGSMDIKSGRLTWVDPHTWTLVAATMMIACRWPSADERQAHDLAMSLTEIGA
jgi:hypothetical protein